MGWTFKIKDINVSHAVKCSQGLFQIRDSQMCVLKHLQTWCMQTSLVLQTQCTKMVTGMLHTSQMTILVQCLHAFEKNKVIQCKLLKCLLLIRSSVAKYNTSYLSMAQSIQAEYQVSSINEQERYQASDLSPIFYTPKWYS